MSPTDTSSTHRHGPGFLDAGRAGRGFAVPTRRDRGCGCGTCTRCAGFTSPVRPRFFAGQLLTDVELTALERYVIDKNRLHNRYLHGWGVVCGLEVACGDCGDDLVVRPGYALDPCGNDVIVPSSQRIDIAQAIQRCLSAERTTPVCDPPVSAPPSRCDDEATWCVTLRYRDYDIRPVVPLVASPSRSCSCGGASCGGASGCGCGCGGASGCGGNGNGAAAVLPPGCEPTRTVECYELGVCRDDGGCHDLADRLAGTMPARILECLRSISGLFQRRVSADAQRVGFRLALDSTRRGDLAKAHDAVCDLYDAVVELYENDPLSTRCTYPQELAAIQCTPQGQNETDEEYLARMRETVRQLLVLVVVYARDCVCDALLPPCPPEPCDDRLILACVTVKDGKVTDICNLACRRYAGSFVSRGYWFPVGPVLGWLAGVLCCFPILAQGRRRGIDPARILRAVDPDAALRTVVADQDFALVAELRRRAARLAGRLRGPQWRAFVSRWLGQRVNLAGYVGRSAASTTSALNRRKMRTRVVEVDDPANVPVLGAGILPLVPADTPIVLYVHRNKVVGFAADSS